MAKPDPTRSDAPEDEARIDDATPPASGRGGPILDNPRSVEAIDHIGVDDQGDLLDPELDEQPGDRDHEGRSFADDVRSDTDVGAGIRESGDT